MWAFGILTVSINFYFMAKINNEFIDQVVHKLNTKEEFKFIIDRLEHSIIMVENDKIEFVNGKFLNQF